MADLASSRTRVGNLFSKMANHRRGAVNQLRAILALMSGDERELPADDEIAAARLELEAALEALRLARGAWSGLETVDISAIRRALETAERQLDRARVRLQRAEERSRGG